MKNYIHPVSLEHKWAKFADLMLVAFQVAFEQSANPRIKRFLNDGDPIQDSIVACRAFKEIGSLGFFNAPRSLYLNSTENVLEENTWNNKLCNSFQNLSER